MSEVEFCQVVTVVLILNNSLYIYFIYNPKKQPCGGRCGAEGLCKCTYSCISIMREKETSIPHNLSKVIQ